MEFIPNFLKTVRQGKYSSEEGSPTLKVSAETAHDIDPLNDGELK